MPRTPQLPPAAATAAYRIFGGLSGARGARIFHPAGAAYEATYSALGDAPGRPRAAIFAEGTTGPALARFSRGLGLPPPFPDFLGLALRLPDAYGEGHHQDFLLASAGTRSRLAVLPVPTRSFFRPALSSLLPYRVDGEVLVVGALAASPAEAGPTPPLAELEATLAARRVRFLLAVAAFARPWRPVAVVEVEARLPDETAARLRFNPWNTGGGLHPAGFANRLRDPAYRGSQAARPRTGPPLV